MRWLAMGDELPKRVLFIMIIISGSVGEAIKPVSSLKQSGQKSAEPNHEPLPNIKRAEKDDHHPFPSRIKGAREIYHIPLTNHLADGARSPSSIYRRIFDAIAPLRF